MEVAAVDIGGTKTYIALVHESGKILRDTGVRLQPTPQDPNEALKIISGWLSEYWKSYDLRAIGIGAPGIVGGVDGGYFVPYVSNLKQWRNFNLRGTLDDILFQRTGEHIPMGIESDVYPPAAAELIARLSINEDFLDRLFPFFYLTMSTGVGGEMAVPNHKSWEIYRPSSGVTEVGHREFHGIASNQSPIICGCENLDCAETWFAGPYLEKRYGYAPEEMPSLEKRLIAKNLGLFLYEHELPRQSRTIVLGGKIPVSWGEEFLHETRAFLDEIYRKRGLLPPNLELSIFKDEAMNILNGDWPRLSLQAVPQLALYKN